MQQSARDQAFRLQRAQAEQMLAAQQKTPLAASVQATAAAKRAEWDRQQAAARERLNTMRMSKSINEDQYQRALMGLVTDNEALVREALATPKAEKPLVSSAQDIDLIRRPYRERRQFLASELQSLRKLANDPLTSTPDVRERAAVLETQIAELFANEERDLAQWRGQKAAPKPPGKASISRARSASEANILSMARKMAGEDSTKVGGDAPLVEWDEAAQTATQPPAEYPDAVWDEARGMWTVVRNGRLMGVK
jgi:hypothetical protein